MLFVTGLCLDTELLIATLSMISQSIAYLPSNLSSQSTSLQFRDKDIAWNVVKCSVQIQVGDIMYYSFIH